MDAGDAGSSQCCCSMPGASLSEHSFAKDKRAAWSGLSAQRAGWQRPEHDGTSAGGTATVPPARRRGPGHGGRVQAYCERELDFVELKGGQAHLQLEVGGMSHRTAKPAEPAREPRR